MPAAFFFNFGEEYHEQDYPNFCSVYDCISVHQHIDLVGWGIQPGYCCPLPI
jgi:hypothetical protein